MKPFNLEEALAGKPVLLRNGSKAYVLHQFKHKPAYLTSLLGYKTYKNAEGNIIESSVEWFVDGSSNMPSHNTIIGMWEKPKAKRFINGIEVPEPVTEETWVDGDCYWHMSLGTPAAVSEAIFCKDSQIDRLLISRRVVFETEEGAKAMAKALLSYKVEYKDGWHVEDLTGKEETND